MHQPTIDILKIVMYNIVMKNSESSSETQLFLDIDALGTPEEWSQIPVESVDVQVSSKVTDTNVKKIIGSVSTNQEIEQALDSLDQN